MLLYYIIIIYLNSKPKTFKKNGFLQPTLGVIFRVCAEPDLVGGITGDQDEDDESTPCIFAANILEGVVSAYPSKQVYAAATPFLSQYMESPDPLMRKAGFIGMTMLVEPCSDQMRAGLKQFVDYTIANFNNPSSEVKVAALATMAQFSEHLRPEILDYHNQVIPAIFALLSGSDPEFQSKACVVFESFAAGMGQEIVQYAPQIIDCLLRIISSGTPDLKESALSALSAMLEECDTGDNVAPYLAPIMDAVKPLCYITKDEEIIVRGRALECIGVIAVMVGRDRFAPFIPEMTKNALDGLAIDSAFSFELHELTLRFFENIAQIVGKEFAAFLPQIMPFCLNTIKSQEFNDFGDGGRDAAKIASCFNAQEALGEVLSQVNEQNAANIPQINEDDGNTFDDFEDALNDEDDDIEDEVDDYIIILFVININVIFIFIYIYYDVL